MKNPTAFGTRQGLDWKCFPATSTSDNATNTPSVSIDLKVDPIAWLAARANVATSTARLFAEIHGFAGCRS